MPLDPIAAIARITAVPSLLRVITEVTGLQLSMIAHVTDDAWTCCAVNDQLGFGLEVGGQLAIATTLCREVRAARAPIVVSHASADPAYCDHPTPKLYQFESYISVPIFLRNGSYFGNVCALDPRPLELHAPRTLAMFQLFAELVGLQIEAETRHAQVSDALLDADATAVLREQFIAVLGHDLRTPLAAIALGAETLARRSLAERDAAIVQRIARSADRIGGLVGDVLDFARGRLGGGIALAATRIDDVAALLRHVVDELQAVHPDRPIALAVDGVGPCDGDPVRLAQLLQNLLGNALTHSPPAAHVGVSVRIGANTLVLVVDNGGPALPDAVLARMFEPYQRGSAARPEGLGLGLYIASQIVRSHGGTIDATSTAERIAITCTLPRFAPTA